MYGIAGEGVLQSPRMQHLQGSAAYSGKDVLKISLKETTPIHDYEQTCKIRDSNYKDSAREESTKNILAQSDHIQSNYQTDEIFDSQTNLKMLKDFGGRSQS